ncbi:MAG: beta-ketoacyl-[acyl-carrier-protein] synthase family protein [Legionellales bacterium]|nr:beta-ketoacyl-[acyl-carrier-protein] synthase family protein [Legionellales bacterium]
MKCIYLNDLGLINALGSNKHNIISTLVNPEATSTLTSYTLILDATTPVGRVLELLLPLPPAYKKYDCRNNQLTIMAYQQIAETVENYKKRYGAHRIGVVMGTSTSGIASGEAAYKHRALHDVFPTEFDYSQQEIGTCSEFLAKYAGITGVHYTISTACSSSGKAIISAARLIQTNICDAVIVGGSDSLCDLTLNGFDALQAISPVTCNPFSSHRDGINIGEGAALFIMSHETSEISLSGWGESSDAYHITSPDPKGDGAKSAIKEALSRAKYLPQDIGYINLHGTATEKNDEVESKIMHELFGEADYYCSSTKSVMGHTLGAAAAQELALCWLLLSEQYNPGHYLPEHRWDGQSDPLLPSLNFTRAETKWQQPRFMSNNFAFGGSNVSLIIERNKNNE